MYTVAGHGISVEPSPGIDDRDWALCRGLARRPFLNRHVQRFDALVAGRTVGRVHLDDLGYEDLHGGLGRAHLVDELAEGCGDFGWGAVVPYVVGSEVHHYDIGLGGGEPARELVVVCNVDCLESAL